MNRRTFFAAPLSVITVGAAGAEETATLHARMIGVWSLEDAVTVKGETTQPWFGRRPPLTGSLIYAANGAMSLQIAGAPPGTISRADFTKLPAAERAVWFDAYYAYFGVFEVDEAAHVVTHRVAHSLLPYEIGAELKRDIKLEGDRLTIVTPPREEGGVISFNRLVWNRSA